MENRPPIQLSKVMEGRPIASSSHLLKLPSTILSDIVQCLEDDSRTLASLALVNTDCRQLARTCQFKNFTVIFPDFLHFGVLKLAKEVHHVETQKDLSTILPALPNLECVRWRGDGTCRLSDSFAGVLVSLDVKELGLEGVMFAVDETFQRSLPTFPLRRLRELRFDMISADRSGSPSYLLENLLRRSMDNLRSLTVGSGYLDDGETTPQGIELPKLRILDVKTHSGLVRFDAWSTLLAGSPSLQSLTMPGFHVTHDNVIDASPNCEALPNLESLVLKGQYGFWNHLQTHLSLPDTNVLGNFIAKHAHVKSLDIDYVTPEKLETMLVPVLCNAQFDNLTKLRLGWCYFRSWGAQQDSLNSHETAFTIHASALSAIGTLTSLEELSMGIGNPRWTRDVVWLLDHDQLRSSIGGLKNLRKLVLQLDVHPTPYAAAVHASRIHFHSRVREWGRYQTLRQEWRNNWRRAHFARTMNEAKMYATLPALETIHLGQRIWRFIRRPANGGANYRFLHLGQVW
ncbi:hypothetical protein OQA88_5173 [Cercophora sp. LCS_1]